MTERGELMRLKSGGPTMTVSGVNKDGVQCKWFEGSKLRSEYFVWALVERVKHDDTPDKNAAASLDMRGLVGSQQSKTD